MPVSKELRQTVIRELCRTRRFKSQSEIRRALARKGFRVDQATVSRDVRELGLVKGGDGYRLPQAGEVPVRQALQFNLRHVLSATAAGNLVVLKTPPGLAAPTAISLDMAEIEGVVGTIAGDDTVFVAAKDAAAARRLARRLVPGGRP